MSYYNSVHRNSRATVVADLMDQWDMLKDLLIRIWLYPDHTQVNCWIAQAHAAFPGVMYLRGGRIPSRGYIKTLTYDDFIEGLNDYVDSVIGEYGLSDRSNDLDGLSAWVWDYFTWFFETVDEGGSISRAQVFGWFSMNIPTAGGGDING